MEDGEESAIICKVEFKEEYISFEEQQPESLPPADEVEESVYISDGVSCGNTCRPTEESSTGHQLEESYESYSESGKIYYKCPTCDMKYKSRLLLDHHSKSCCKTFSCEFSDCEASFDSFNSLKGHIKIYHPIEYICNVCKKIFYEKDQLLLHLGSHRELSGLEKLHCPYDKCEAFYYVKGQLSRHIRSLHEGKFQCTYKGCTNVRASTKYALLIHMKSHTNPLPVLSLVKSHVLEKSKDTGTGTSIKEEMKIPEDSTNVLKVMQDLRTNLFLHENSEKKPFPCTYDKCSKIYYSKSRLRKHVRNFHEGEFKCIYEGCSNIRLSSVYRLAHHLKLHHLSSSCSGEDEPIKKKKRREKSCGKCSRSFKSKRDLDRHMVTHQKISERKIFSCMYDNCPKFYYYERNLATHVQHKHAYETVLNCTFENCNRKLSSQAMLEYHLMCHGTEGLLPSFRVDGNDTRRTRACEFICDVCKKMFKFKRKLRLHLTVHQDISQRKILPCPYSASCQKLFCSADSIAQHVKHVHKRNKEKDSIQNSRESALSKDKRKNSSLEEGKNDENVLVSSVTSSQECKPLEIDKFNGFKVAPTLSDSVPQETEKRHLLEESDARVPASLVMASNDYSQVKGHYDERTKTSELSDFVPEENEERHLLEENSAIVPASSNKTSHNHTQNKICMNKMLEISCSVFQEERLSKEVEGSFRALTLSSTESKGKRRYCPEGDIGISSELHHCLDIASQELKKMKCLHVINEKSVLSSNELQEHTNGSFVISSSLDNVGQKIKEKLKDHGKHNETISSSGSALHNIKQTNCVRGRSFSSSPFNQHTKGTPALNNTGSPLALLSLEQQFFKANIKDISSILPPPNIKPQNCEDVTKEFHESVVTSPLPLRIGLEEGKTRCSENDVLPQEGKYKKHEECLEASNSLCHHSDNSTCGVNILQEINICSHDESLVLCGNERTNIKSDRTVPLPLIKEEPETDDSSIMENDGEWGFMGLPPTGKKKFR